jgi:sarcosine oxidase
LRVGNPGAHTILYPLLVTYDAIVIGAGGMGSAAAYHLAARGARVLALERFDIPHEMGSSHGASRLIRLAYFEDPRYVPLLRRAYALWRELEQRAGERLLIVTGGIDAGAENGAMVRGSRASCELHRLPHQVLDAAAAARRWPALRLAPDMCAVWQPDAGFLLPERCILAHVEAARAWGAGIHTRERVLGWEAGAAEAEVRVRTDRGEYRALRLILTAGAWTAGLVPDLRSLAVPERQVVLWTQPRRPEIFAPDRFPVVNLESPEGHFYSTPIYGVPGCKFGKYHHLRQTAPADDIDRACHPRDEAAVREGIRMYFPEADGPALAMKACIFTNSPDGNFIIDRHPAHPNVVIAAGFSGHGFKFASVVGEILADLALAGGTHHDIGFLSIGRFDTLDA